MNTEWKKTALLGIKEDGIPFALVTVDDGIAVGLVREVTEDYLIYTNRGNIYRIYYPRIKSIIS